jgi:hypothetical protein
MDENRNAGVHIGQLNLRMPGRGAEPGHRVADGIARSLARTVPADMHRRLGALSVRVHVPAGASETDMTDAVAGAIVRALHKSGPAR